MEKVSIIVAMFNCEKTIENLITSLIQQTYKNLEILLIDDGSSDTTLKICKNYIKDSRIKIFSQNHLGVSAARNKGIQLATGSLMYFCDADDYLELELVEKMVNACTSNNVDLVMSGYFIDVYLKNLKPYTSKVTYKNKKYPTIDRFKNDFVYLWDIPFLQTVWNKLYIANIIKNNNILFEDINFGEDIAFNRQYLLKISSAYILEAPLYHYAKNGNTSLTEKYIDNLFEIRKKEYYEFCNYFKTFGIPENEYREYVSRRHIEKLIDCVKNFSKSDCPLTLKNKISETKQIMNDSLTIDCLRNAKLKSKKLKLFTIPFRLKLPALEILMFSFSNFIKRSSPYLFNLFKNWGNT